MQSTESSFQTAEVGEPLTPATLACSMLCLSNPCATGGDLSFMTSAVTVLAALGEIQELCWSLPLGCGEEGWNWLQPLAFPQLP